MMKIRLFWLLRPFPRVIDHIFGVTGRFTTTVIPDTCLRGMTKKLSFSRFMVVFMSYCPRFWGSRGIAWPVRPDTCFRVMNKKLVIYLFYGHFHELLPIFLEL